MSGEANRPPFRFELDPDTTAPEAILASSVDLLTTSLETSFAIGELPDKRTQKKLLAHASYLVASCLLLGVDPMLYVQRFYDLLVGVEDLGWGHQEITTALTEISIYSGQRERAIALHRGSDPLTLAGAEGRGPILKTADISLTKVYWRRLVYEGDDDSARRLAIRQLFNGAPAWNLAGLSCWEELLGRPSEAEYTVKLAWQTIDLFLNNEIHMAPSTLSPEYESDDISFPYFGQDIRRHRLIAGGYVGLLTPLGHYREMAERTLHRAVSYIQRVYEQGGSLNGNALHTCTVEAAAIGSLEDTLTLMRLAPTRARSDRSFLHERHIDLALAKRFIQENEFEQARRLLVAHTDDLDTLSLQAFLVAKRDGIPQAIAAIRTPCTGADAGAYALKHVAMSAVDNLAAEDPDGALAILDSIDRGWGDSWSQLKPSIEPAIRRAEVYRRAKDYGKALAVLNGMEITDLTDMLFIMQALELITFEASR